MILADPIEARILQRIDEHREEIVSFARDIYTHAELGYKETRTASRFAQALNGLGIPTQEGLAITGVKGRLNPQKGDNVTLALLGELDALMIPNQKYANPETGAAHSCGHHCQLSGVLGAAIALSDPEVAAALDGQVVFFGVPAEEYGEIAFRNELKQEGKIRYAGGKCELIAEGAFDDVDLSLAHHSLLDVDVTVQQVGSNGFVSKIIRYHGKAAHAAEAPHLGVNALSAAAIGLTALQYQRETFQEKDTVRIHPILTRGGDLVNVVPEEVVVETLVRASSQEAIRDAADKTDRAFFAGGMAVGARTEIETLPGYLPKRHLENPPELVRGAQLAAGERYPVHVVDGPGTPDASSTDVGDLQHIQPVFTFNTGGMAGKLHGSDFDIVDEELAYVVTAKVFALTAYNLLKDGAAGAKRVLKRCEPVFTKEEYLNYLESMEKTEVRP